MPRYVDLTQPLSPLTARSSDHPEVTFRTLRWYSRNGLKTREITASLHSGTHMDTSALYYSNGETIDQVALSRMIGPAMFVDCRMEEFGAITGDHLEKHASSLTSDDMLVLCTGWHHFADDEEKYILKSPGLDKSGIDWVASRSPKALCSDCPSPEHIYMRVRYWRQLRPDIFPKDPDPEVFPRSYGHRTLLPKGILMIENLGGDIDEMIGRRAMMYALPPKYAGVEAAPVRAIAVIED